VTDLNSKPYPRAPTVICDELNPGPFESRLQRVDGALLKGLSWIVLFAPELWWTAGKNPGVPLKNYIDQSQEFALCMVALTPFVITLYKRQGVGKTGLAAEVTKTRPIRRSTSQSNGA
jgi:hypothetical protein